VSQQEQAATRIQAVYRGFRTRVKLKEQAEQFDTNGQPIDSSCLDTSDSAPEVAVESDTANLLESTIELADRQLTQLKQVSQQAIVDSVQSVTSAAVETAEKVVQEVVLEASKELDESLLPNSTEDPIDLPDQLNPSTIDSTLSRKMEQLTDDVVRIDFCLFERFIVCPRFFVVLLDLVSSVIAAHEVMQIKRQKQSNLFDLDRRVSLDVLCIRELRPTFWLVCTLTESVTLLSFNLA
jgi:hypothetical protein